MATASLAAPVFLGGASAVAEPLGARTHPVHAAKAATSDERRQASSGDLVLRLDGVPAEFEAGGEWQEFDLVLENTSEEDAPDLDIDIDLVTITPDDPLRSADVSVQFRSNGVWVDAYIRGSAGSGGVSMHVPADGMVLPPGRSAMPVRMKFAKDAPLVQFR
ncbi:hypothetical protein GTW37_25130, partial [Streptomyces sp. SID4931]|nr:hypothetical protein [Streptomyces sp. SID4931]